LFLIDASRQFVAKPGVVDPEPVKGLYGDAISRALERGETGVSNRIPFPEADHIAIVVPVWAKDQAEGQPIGAVGALLKADRLESTFFPFVRGDTMIAVATNGTIIAAPPAADPEATDLTVYLAEPIAAAAAGASGSLTYRDGTGAERLAVYSPVTFPGVAWAVIVTNPAPTPYGPNRTLLETGLAALAIAVAATLVIAIILGELTARPIRHLTEQAAALAQGDFSRQAPVAGGGEVGELSEAFSDMADRLATQVADLEAAREERQIQAEQLRELHRRTVRLQEDERRRIAGEIHDAVSPLITGALYQARALRLANGGGTNRDEALSAVGDLLERATEELHGVIFDLRPPDLDDIGVVAAIERYVQQVQRTGLACRLEVVGEPQPLTPEVRLGIYRIVQEALHNALRHAGADEVVVRLESSGEWFRVTIRDNGAGFDPERAGGPTSLGLLSMRERASAIGASFEISSRTGGGTAIVIERPLSGDPDQLSERTGEVIEVSGS
jgi:signal transduction histidine kinase